ncbi:VOC family protein [Aggregatimonas sangjinii]|uniref:VOC family protein n=1 Tax=Aggregatimonas sangjinii TaxID=2583587 RepID=A0A5B7SPV1_9FLAO|nr:VOC family protein [Aggregatimonas sangjinii]QCW99039.1 VOC family protein [Aggregatimonas sangjinii]
MAIPRKIDHIVYAVQDLDASISEFEEKLGMRPIFGGFHKVFGTKNALISLGDACYLELLAGDNTNTAVPKPRWMGVDMLQTNQITRWALKSNQLKMDSEILKNLNPEMGIIRGGSRNVANGGSLEWGLIMPLPYPEVELLPFMVDWSTSTVHPTDKLPDMGCRLLNLYGTHPTPKIFDGIFEQLNIDLEIKTSTEIKLTAIIECPNGTIEI